MEGANLVFSLYQLSGDISNILGWNMFRKCFHGIVPIIFCTLAYIFTFRDAAKFSRVNASTQVAFKGQIINERSRKENSSNFRATFGLSSDLSVTHDRKHQNNIQQHIAFSVTPLRSHVTFAIRKFSESTCHIDHFVDAVSLLYLILRPLQKRLLCIFFLNSYLLLKYHTKLKS